MCSQNFWCGRRVVVGAVPVDGFVFADYFARALAGDGNGADVADAAQAVEVAAAAASLTTSKVPRRLTLKQLFSDLRLREARSG